MARPIPEHDAIPVTVASVSGAGATITASYPFGKSAKDYLGGFRHYITSSARTLFARSGDFVVTFGLTNITIVLTTNVAFAAGAQVTLFADRAGEEKQEALANPATMDLLELVRVTLGAVATAVSTAVCASQALLAVNNGLINGTLAAGGIATFQTPRNVVAAWTGTSVLTVTGTDEYGNVLVESSASGTTFTGKKAFKTITRIKVSADVTGLTVGNGVVLGLPCVLLAVPDALRESVNDALPTAGVFVAADRTLPATALTGDVRGTWAPNAAPNGTNFYEASIMVRSTSYRGAAQFAG